MSKKIKPASGNTYTLSAVTRSPPILCISDLHCGSSRALCPPGFRTNEGHGIALSQLQEWLWTQWETMQKDVVGALGKGFTLVVNGDLIEGIHHRTTQIVSADVGDHFRMATDVLEPIAKLAGKIYVVLGTETHTGASSESGIGKILGAVRCPHTGSGAWDRLDIPYGQSGELVRFIHHIGTSTRMQLYATQLSIQIGEHQLQAARMGMPIPRVLVAGHRHTYGAYTDSRGLCISLPPWQGLTRFGYRVAGASEVQVGAVVLEDAGEFLPSFHAWTRTLQ